MSCPAVRRLPTWSATSHRWRLRLGPVILIDQGIIGPTTLPDRDALQKVQTIREFVLENISKKISRTMLLREVGSGSKKIQEGFRTIYGKGMFDVLHEEWMEHRGSGFARDKGASG